MGHVMPRIVLATFMIAALSCGCGRTVSTAPVVGTVTYKGKPVQKVGVAFIPERGAGGCGLTDASGNFTLSTFKTGDGVVLGKHKVVISETWGGAGGKPPPYPGTPEFEQFTRNKRKFVARYSDPSTTPLSVEVMPGKTNEFTFELTD